MRTGAGSYIDSDQLRRPQRPHRRMRTPVEVSSGEKSSDCWTALPACAPTRRPDSNAEMEAARGWFVCHTADTSGVWPSEPLSPAPRVSLHPLVKTKKGRHAERPAFRFY